MRTALKNLIIHYHKIMIQRTARKRDTQYLVSALKFPRLDQLARKEIHFATNLEVKIYLY